MQIVIINGTPGSGKDQFVKEVQSLIGDYRCYNYSTVDFVKFVALCAGWKEDKTPRNRKFLSDLKKLLAYWNDVPYQKTRREIEDAYRYADTHGCLNESVMFIHCREPEEIDRFVNDYYAHTLLVQRAAADEIEQSNSSDANVSDYAYDVIVENNGTIEDLSNAARTYITEILGLTI